MTRISQRQMYSTFVGNMNNNLADLMESNLQGSSEKRINRPSDDPAGMARVLGFRASLEGITQYKRNTGVALGWLTQADTTLIQVDELIAEIRTKAEQISTGTYTDENREQVSFYLREAFGTLLSLSNSTYDGQHIFGGHKTKTPTYVEGLHAFSNNADMQGVDYVVTGGAKNTVLVQFTQDGVIGSTSTLDMNFRYSADGGKTWQAGYLPAGSTTIQAGGVEIELKDKATGLALSGPVNVTAAAPADTSTHPSGPTDGPSNPNETDNGTWIYAHPTAIYKGDDNDAQVTQTYASGGGPSALAEADGYFTRDVAVRIDSIAGGVITYSYSLDDGSNWVQGTAPDGPNAKLPIAGGFLNLSGPPAVAGDQYVVKPHRADIKMEISPGDTVTVNVVGKDIFGGMYQKPFADDPTTVGGSYDNNLFHVVGKLIAGAETNSQTMVQEALAQLEDCLKKVTTRAAEVGGRENRVGVVFENMGMRELAETDNMSKIEDVDVTVLMTKLAQQQLAYNMVLKSSSMIMQMNLANFI